MLYIVTDQTECTEVYLAGNFKYTNIIQIKIQLSHQQNEFGNGLEIKLWIDGDQ